MMSRRGALALAIGVLWQASGCASRARSTAGTPDTGADAAGELRDEAGFFDVPPQAHGAPYSARLFYVFEVGDGGDPATLPLVVLFAGGPGYPSSLDLLPYGLARSTLPAPGLAGPPAPNPARWTTFANVLFVDERQSGFSYGLASDGLDASACSFSPIDDAADAVRAVLQFLDGHPALRSAPVILVGQSYGGERVTLALDLLLRYPTEAARADAALVAEIQAHYDAVFPALAGAPITETAALSQFGHAVLLQPLVLGGAQYDAQLALAPSDPFVGSPAPGSDPYDVRQPQGWSNAIEATASTALAAPGGARALFGVAPTAIEDLGPGARTGAFRVSTDASAGAAPANAGLTSALGPLRPEDAYLVYPATACPVGPEVLYGSAGSSVEFAANLQQGVRTFISDARYDAVIYSPAIPAALAAGGATVKLDTAPRAGVDRPGWFDVSSADGGTDAAVEVRFPPYTASGHFVAVAQPQELHDDVASWLASP